MALVGQQHHAADGGQEGAERRGAGDEEHDQHLVLGGADRVGAGDDLAGHHAGQGDEAGGRHGVEHRHHAGAQRRAQRSGQRLEARCAERKPRLDGGALAARAPR